MTRDERRDAARRAVGAQMADRGFNPTDLAREAKVDPDTVGDFLAGKRWPKISTQGKIERALHWPPGTIGHIESTGDVPVVRSSMSEVELIREKAERMPAAQRANLLQYAEFLETQSRQSGSTGQGF